MGLVIAVSVHQGEESTPWAGWKGALFHEGPGRGTEQSSAPQGGPPTRAPPARQGPSPDLAELARFLQARKVPLGLSEVLR